MHVGEVIVMHKCFDRIGPATVLYALVVAACATPPSRTTTVPRPAIVQLDLRLRAPRPSKPVASEAAVRARAAFWSAFYAERYDAIPGVLRQLGAAVLENPRDAET